MIEGRAMGALGANCYLLSCPETKKVAVIDPGADGKGIYRWILEKGYTVEFILLTHGHFDHIGGVNDLRELCQGKVGIHKGDAAMLTDGKRNFSALMGSAFETQPADFLIEDGQVLTVGQLSVTVLATPGHTPGGVCFLTPEGLISGDTLFEGTVGRTDFPGGSMEQLLDGIEKKLMVLPDETRVYPGHGSDTTIGREKRENPYLR